MINMEMILREDWSSDRYNLWLIKRIPNGSTLVAKPIKFEFEEKESGAFMLPDPTFQISRQEATSMFQSAANWMAEKGIRPNTDKISGQLEILKEHSKFIESNHCRLMSIVEQVIKGKS